MTDNEILHEYIISIEYNKDLYDSIMIKQILDSYIEVVRNINNLENSDIRNCKDIIISLINLCNTLH